MATIEERAAKAYSDKRQEIYLLTHSANGELFNPILTYEDGYIQGATEQKREDDETHTEEMRKLNEEWMGNLALRKAIDIDKACRILTEMVKDGTISQFKARFIIDFRKKMEE